MALIRVVGERVELVAHDTRPMPNQLRDDLVQLGQGVADNLDRLGQADTDLGRFIGRSIKQFLHDKRLPDGEPRAIGSHGQTVRHRPEGTAPFTLQIGDPNQIAEITRTVTVADFRRRDLAAGGEAAPLVPPFHAKIFASDDEHRAVFNIGGIGNLTVIKPLRGFDSGPGNALMDAWCERHTGKPFDDAGDWALGGTVVPGLLSKLLEDAYLRRAPPKSTGKEHYNLTWLDAILPPALAPPDVQRTLVEFTAKSATDALHHWAPATQRLLVCGGGRLNRLLMQRLAGLARCAVQSTDDYGWNGDAIEASAFAWLAHQRLASQPGNVPEVTGAAGARILGAVYAP